MPPRFDVFLFSAYYLPLFLLRYFASSSSSLILIPLLERNTGADCTGLVTGSEAMDRAYSGTTKLNPLEENMGGAAVQLTKENQQIKEAAAMIPLEGERYPEALEKLTGL
jgi:hypothetical protein